MALKNQVFISYAHADAADWTEAFQTMLNPAVALGQISLWSDGAIDVGANWREQIERALGSAGAGLLLVTPGFFNSSFITSVELARLLNIAKTEHVPIWWVPVSSTLYESTPLADIKAASDPKTPLDLLDPPQRRAAIRKICSQLVADFGFLPKVTRDHRSALSKRVESRLAERFEMGEEVGAGRFCIVYKARQISPGRDVAVKLFAASEFDEWASRTFEEAVTLGARLKSPAFIKIIEQSNATPQFLVTELVQGEPLSKYLQRYPSGMPLSAVRRVLRDLIVALQELHDQGRIRGELYPSNVLIERTGTPRLSTVDLSTVASEQSRLSGDFRVDRESLTYMTPERFVGEPHTARSDQFSLGLIAMEMLGGDRIPSVNCPRDLEDKRQLFNDLETAEGRWAKRSRDFSGLVSRMLRTDPQGRWPSLTKIYDFLHTIEIAETDEERARRVAKSSYLRLQSGGGDRAFFERFYANLFARCREVERLFTPERMAHQQDMLNQAIHLLLDFDPASGCPQLRGLATRHGEFGVTRRHYELFIDALVRTLEESEMSDPAELAAWRTTLAPAIEFMWTCQGAPADPPAAGV
jgi:hemoglobin-like flavoprotein/tRNA A-37 threonylcarbamoyl transferase component Bud32